MGQLCTIEDIEKYLLKTYNTNPSDYTATEEQLNYLIDGVSAEIENICNRKFNLDTYNEVHDIDGSKVFLSQYPINSITTVEYGDPFSTTDRIPIESTDYFSINDSGIVSLNLTLRRAEQYVHVVYSAGYETIPDDLNLICVKAVVAELNNTSKDSNISKEKLGALTYEYRSTAEKKENMTNSLVNYIKSDI